MADKKNVLFLCTGNSCRSQMAEGFGNLMKSETFRFFSAGTKKSQVNPNALEVMKECDVDLSTHHSKTTEDLPPIPMDYVITVCSDAHETCPYFPGGKIIHYGFDDPPRLTQGMTDRQEILNVFRRVRNEIKDFVENIEGHLSWS